MESLALTSIQFPDTLTYLEGQGGETIGQCGYSRDHRPVLMQTVVMVVMDGEGRPVSCELLPVNTADVTTLDPLVARLRQQFDIREMRVAADRGMISEYTITDLTRRGVRYILGARLRRVKEIRETVLQRAGRCREVHGPREYSKAPSPLKVKRAFVEKRRDIVCRNDE